jgi:malonate decarboxylase alpha subunit
MRTWQEARGACDARVTAGGALAKHKIVETRDVFALVEAVIRPGSRVCLEGDNQRQGDCLAKCLAAVDVHRVHNVRMAQSGVRLSEHLDGFESGVAKRLDYAHPGPHSSRNTTMLFAGRH